MHLFSVVDPSTGYGYYGQPSAGYNNHGQFGGFHQQPPASYDYPHTQMATLITISHVHMAILIARTQLSALITISHIHMTILVGRNQSAFLSIRPHTQITATKKKPSAQKTQVT
ncbi:hypothetical protein niasHT_003229 [Heterodera trifolii]|uniref:Uncharacterized protein n=1 Tax=Heterodera trifolii TaxID=157864 RepID=A0ABD2MAD4_9BILA